MNVASIASTVFKILLRSEEVYFCGIDSVFVYDAFIGSLIASLRKKRRVSADAAYIKTTQGWLCLTINLGLADRKIIGWSLSSTMKAVDTVIPAWKMAQKNRSITTKLIFHSDRGIQYACNEFKSLLDKNPLVIRSMSRKGNCWDNAVAESFFKTSKVECVYQNKFINKQQAAIVVFEYIEIWYNKNRQHSALGYVSPKEYEELLNMQKIAA